METFFCLFKTLINIVYTSAAYNRFYGIQFQVTNNVVTVINEVIEELSYRSAGEETTEDPLSVSNQNYALYLEKQMTNLQRNGIQANFSTSNLEITSFKFSNSNGGIDLKSDEGDKTDGIEVSFPPDLMERTTRSDGE